jgi:hypothetical protein
MRFIHTAFILMILCLGSAAEVMAFEFSSSRSYDEDFCPLKSSSSHHNPPPFYIDDKYENNDEPHLGTLITQNSILYAVHKNDDWYKIVTPHDASYIKITTLSSPNTSFNLKLYNSERKIIDRSCRISESQSLTFPVNGNETYYALITSNIPDNTPYSMSIYMLDGIDDEYEENDSIRYAADISDKQTINTRSFDRDCFRIHLPEVDRQYDFEVRLTHQEVYIELPQMTLYDERRFGIAWGSYERGSERILRYLDRGGDYYVCYSGHQGQPLELAWTATPLETPSFLEGFDGEDWYEPNNSKIKATHINGDTREDIVYYSRQFDDDWYKFVLKKGQTAAIDLKFIHSNGNIDMELFDTANKLIAKSANYYDKERVVLTSQRGSYYWLRVYNDNAGNEYSLTWRLLDSTFIDDEYEENEYPNQTNITNINELQGIQWDDDMFQIDLTESSGILNVTVEFQHDDGDINMELYDEKFRIPVAVSNTQSDIERISHRFVKPGPYYVKVHQGNKGNTYTLQWNVEPLPPGEAKNAMKNALPPQIYELLLR